MLSLLQAFEGSADAPFDSSSLAAVITGYRKLAGLSAQEVSGDYEDLPMPPPPPMPPIPTTPPTPPLVPLPPAPPPLPPGLPQLPLPISSPPSSPPSTPNSTAVHSASDSNSTAPADESQLDGMLGADRGKVGRLLQMRAGRKANPISARAPRRWLERKVPSQLRGERAPRQLAQISGLDMTGCTSTTLSKKTVVTVTISTLSESAYSSLMALASSSPTFAAAALTAAVPVTNSNGQLFAMCTSSVVFNASRSITLAPSPPPPAPPPVSDALGGLDILDFVNVTIPASAALTTLLTTAAPTVQAVATALVATAITGAAGGGGSPAALAGAQRLSILGMLGGAPSSCDDPRSTGSGGGWTMGRLGMGSLSNPCTSNSSSDDSATSANWTGTLEGTSSGGGGGGRRLTSKNKEKGKNDQQEAEEEEEVTLTQKLLMVVLVDTLVSVSTIIGSIIGIHILILCAWQFIANCKYYSWVKRGPTRVIYVSKPAGERLGIDLVGCRVVAVHADSPCSRFLSPNDELLLINGQSVTSSEQGSSRICAASELYLLVSAHLLSEGACDGGNARRSRGCSKLCLMLPCIPPWRHVMRIQDSLAQLFARIRWAGSNQTRAIAMRTFASLSVGAGLCLAATLGPSTHGNIGIGLGLFFFVSLTFCPCLTVCLHYCGTWGLYAVEGSNTRVAPEPLVATVAEMHIEAGLPVVPTSTTTLSDSLHSPQLAARGTKQQGGDGATTEQQDSDNAAEQMNAAKAVLLQSVWRRQAAVRSLAEAREQKRIDELTVRFATKLQAMARRKKAQRELESNGAARRLQARWRNHAFLAKQAWPSTATSGGHALMLNGGHTLDPIVPLASPPPSPPMMRRPHVSPGGVGGRLAFARAHASKLPMHKLPTRRMSRHYAKVAKAKTLRPHFRSLPEALLWPNLEVAPPCRP